MGNYFTINMEENFKKNQDFITEMNKVKIERQVHLQNQMRERVFAMEIAKERELFYWFGAFYIMSVTACMIRYRYRKDIGGLAPIVPLSFIMAYQADLAYGSKLYRIKAEADHIMQFEQDILALPCDLPTASEIDSARLQTEELKKIHPSTMWKSDDMTSQQSGSRPEIIC